MKAHSSLASSTTEKRFFPYLLQPEIDPWRSGSVPQVHVPASTCIKQETTYDLQSSVAVLLKTVEKLSNNINKLEMRILAKENKEQAFLQKSGSVLKW